ncbi:MAG: PP2C family protein-serine/threonine phosphatase [Janthinobacterium lividum]
MDTKPLDDAMPEPKLRQGQEVLSPEYVAAYADMPANPPSGGDFHDAFLLDKSAGDVSPVAVVIGDVAGHGPEQALQAEHMRELLSDCLTVGLTPAETLSAVNAMIEPDPNFEGFGTVFVGTLESETGILTYASGGHEPALIAPANAEDPDVVLELEGTGPPVGAFPPTMTRFEEHQTTLPPGGTLLLYTDGVSDARPPQSRLEWLGLDRLKSLLVQLASLPPRRLVLGLLRRVAAFCQGQFLDDVAVLAIRRKNSPK